MQHFVQNIATNVYLLFIINIVIRGWQNGDCWLVTSLDYFQ